MRFFVLSLALLLSNTPVLANSISQNSFAYGHALQLDNNGPIFKLDVPEHVYQTVTDSNYADIRIYNASGVAVPHLLKHKKPVIKEKVPAVHIPFFPMRNKSDKEVTVSGAPSIRIETNSEGAIVNIDSQRGSIDPAWKNTADYYILDTSQLKTKPSALTINWKKDHADFNETINIRGSNDLANWSTLVDRAPVTNLKFAGHNIIKRRIEIGHHSYKYLSLRWSSDVPLKLTSILGHFDSTLIDKKRNILNIASNRFDEKTRRFYFTVPGHYPIDRVTVKLQPKNAILLATVSSSNKPEGPWKEHFSGLVYKLEKDGKTVLPSEISLPRSNNDRYWRMTATNEQDGLASMSPVLESGWLPHKLFFVAQGNPPFTLTYGLSQAKPNDNTALRKLLNTQDSNEKFGIASVGQRLSFTGADAVKPVVDNSAKWKAAILWGVLLLGLLALLVMVLRLYKQMDNQ